MNDTSNTSSHATIDCKGLEKLIVDFLDDNLPMPQRMLFIEHIGECKHCEDYLQNYRQTIELSKAALSEGKFDEHQKIPDKMIEAIMAASGSAR